MGGLGGGDVFFENQLERVGEGPQQSVRAHAHGAKANLEVRQRLALDPVQEPHHGQSHSREDDEHINQCPELVPRLAGRHLAAEIRGDEIGHQRSTSPCTMSIVPMTATTSATSAPRTIRSSACRLTNDGGRTRKREGCVEPSLTMKYPSSPLGASME